MSALLRVKFLGTGASFGVPVIGCRCAVCRSADPRDHRCRSSVCLQWQKTKIVIDTGPDFHDQCIRAGIDRLDAIWYTHAHADHTAGLDDVRPFCFLPEFLEAGLPVRAQKSTLDELLRRFGYAFQSGKNPYGVSKPTLRPVVIDGPFEEGGQLVTPVPVHHGPFAVLGFRIGNFAYVTDVNEIPASSMKLLEGVEVLVLSGLRPKPHPTHFNLEQAAAVAAKIGARRTILTHLTHDVSAHDLESMLPAGVEAGTDGLVLELPL